MTHNVTACKQPFDCPSNSECLYKDLIYKATVTRHDNTPVNHRTRNNYTIYVILQHISAEKSSSTKYVREFTVG